MAYFVQAEDGLRYGPLERDEVRQWLSDGRLMSHSILVDSITGARVPVGDVVGMSAFPRVPPKKNNNSGLMIGLVAMLTFCVIPFLAAVLIPTFRSARVAAQRSTELTHAKQLAAAALLYADDHDDRFPPAFSSNKDLHFALGEYVVDPAAFVATNPAGGEFRGNSAVAGRRLEEISEPASVPLIYDSKRWRGVNRITVGFVDGHARDIPVDQFLKAINPDRSAMPRPGH